jgi:GT2 family glycosyltransferase
MGDPDAWRHAIDAVVLNYRTPLDTLNAVRSLAASQLRPRSIYVIDNDQSAECRAALAPTWGLIDYRQMASNLGYSEGMNAGVRAALDHDAAAVLLVNSDVLVPPDCIGELCNSLDSAPLAGIAGPVIVAHGEPDRVASLGLSYRTVTGRMKHIGVGRSRRALQLPATHVVDAVSGCFMLIRRRTFEEVGLLESAYFFTFEDLDLCLRARRKGLETVLASRAFVYHEGGRSLDSRSPRRHYFGVRNHLLLAERLSSPEVRAATLYRTVCIVLLNVAYAVRCGPSLLPARLGAVARGIHDHRLGRYGADG